MFQRPRGTRDFTPTEMDKRRHVESRFRAVNDRFGFREIMTPTFEHLALFTTKSGPSVIEETYSFKDKGGREMALRPEFTPNVVRMYLDSMQRLPKPLKLYYFGTCFRYDEPQKGRYREFFQFGAEIIGGDDISADAEIIALAVNMLEDVGLTGFVLRIGNIGILRDITRGLTNQQKILHSIDKKDFAQMRQLLEADDALNLEEKIVKLSSITGDEKTIEVAKSVVGEGEGLKAFEYLERLVQRLRSYGIEDYILDFGVVRGLDYYTGMVFEVDCPRLGAEKQICGGGSYALIRLFGGEKIFSTGFGMGFDRVMLALEEQGMVFSVQKIKAFVLPLDESVREASVEIVTLLRKGGITTDVDIGGRTASKALRYADSTNAEYAVLINPELWKEKKVIVRNLESGDQSELEIDGLVEFLSSK